MNLKKLPRHFFARDTHVVARALLGRVLVRVWRGTTVAGRITEVESYVGTDDLACHAARGHTSRTAVMFGAAGHAYVYLIYGRYHCFNIVTDRPGFPAAVLVRALAPLEGIPAMQRRRHSRTLMNLTTGPGKLTQALTITRALTGEDLTTSSRLFVVDDGYRVAPGAIATSTRIGVAYAGVCADYPWRYYLRNSEYVSRPYSK